MLFMLIRTALWGLAIIAAAMAFVWLKESDGGVTLTLEGRAYGPFRLIETLLIVVVSALAIWFAVRAFGFAVALVRFFSGDETALSRFWNRSRERRGFDALAGGLAALSEGDGKRALERARKAERMLDRPALTRLLMAQAAEAAGDRGLARETWKQLAADPKTAFAGVKGLLETALREGDKPRALALADRAAELKPADGDTLQTLFALRCEAKDWEGARRALDGLARAGAIGRDVATRRGAVLLLAEAEAAEAKGETMKARELAERAHRAAPGLAPATAMLAARQGAEPGGRRKAEKTLAAGWRAEPHPDLAAAFAALAPEETPRERRRRFADLTKTHPEHAETRMLAAELALADDDPKAARIALGDLSETAPTARALALRAAVEKASGAPEAAVRGWLARAVAAPRGPQWTCGACGRRHAAWAPVCERCEAFDSLAWSDGEAPGAADAAAALLPVLAEAAEPARPAANGAAHPAAAADGAAPVPRPPVAQPPGS